MVRIPERELKLVDVRKFVGKRFVINGEIYTVGDPDAYYKGFSGRVFYIRVKETGEIFETDNLWHGGPAPAGSKDTAEWVEVVREKPEIPDEEHWREVFSKKSDDPFEIDDIEW